MILKKSKLKISSILCVNNFITVSTKLGKELTFGKLNCSGRNNSGRITVLNRGGGVKRKYRIIDFFRYI